MPLSSSDPLLSPSSPSPTRAVRSLSRSPSSVKEVVVQTNYYSGSSEPVTESQLTVTRLETRRKLTEKSSKLILALVGLPGRGKSFVARKLLYHITWSGIECKIFNVGRYRRAAYAETLHQSESSTTASAAAGSASASERDQKGLCDADFFDANNAQATAIREKAAEMALTDMLQWLDGGDDDEDDSGEFEQQQSSSSSPPDNIMGTSRHSRTSSVMSSCFGSSTAPKLDFHQHERIAIFDATNSTHKRRQWILEQCTSPINRPGKPTGVVFVESICDDTELLNENFKYKVLNSPDYEGVTPEEAMNDLRVRVQKYEEQYQTITDDSLSYIKIFNLSTKLLVNHVYGRMAKELVPAFMAWHIGSRPIFLCRPGQTISGIQTDGEDYVARSKVDPHDPRFLDMSAKTKRKNLRGDTLGQTGITFRDNLYEFLFEEVQMFLVRRASVQDMSYTGTSVSGLHNPKTASAPTPLNGESYDDQYQYQHPPRSSSMDASFNHGAGPSTFPCRILTSTMPRATDTVSWEVPDIDFNIERMSNLNPLDKGDFAGMELDEINELNPDWYAKLARDPFLTRFTGGECYRDLIMRLKSVVIDMEQQVIPTLVVSHVSILQCLMAYFRNTPVEKCMEIEVPMHTVIKFEPVRGGGWRETQHSLYVDNDSLTRGHAVSPMQRMAPTPPVGSPEYYKHMITTSSVGEFSAVTFAGGGGGGTTPPLGPPPPIWGDHVRMVSPPTETKEFVRGTGFCDV